MYIDRIEKLTKIWVQYELYELYTYRQKKFGPKLDECKGYRENHLKYLGLPTFVGRLKRQVFDFIQEWVWKKLKGRKETMLSQAAKRYSSNP